MRKNPPRNSVYENRWLGQAVKKKKHKKQNTKLSCGRAWMQRRYEKWWRRNYVKYDKSRKLKSGKVPELLVSPFPQEAKRL